MKFWKHSIITALAFFGIASTVLFTACEEDSCLKLTCKNGGSCADGYCRCPSGFEGSECETKSATKFLGRFVGTTKCDNFPTLVDTMDIFMKAEPSLVGMVRRGNVTDTIYGNANGMFVNVAEVALGNYRKYVSAHIELKKFTFYVEEVQNINDLTTKQVCTFIGYR